jgi:hypothetical protein
MDQFQPPFRWNLRFRESLGSLVEGERAASYPEFTDDLLTCAAQCVAFSQNADMYFIGRSPESVFDLLSGLLLDTPWSGRLQLVQFSMRYITEDVIRHEIPGALQGIRAYFQLLELSPEQLIARKQRIALIDLVASGETLGNVVGLLHSWTRDLGLDWRAVKAKMCIVGITWEEDPSPNTWRWSQHADWVGLLNRQAIKNIAIPRRLWDYLGNRQDKVTESFHPWRWPGGALAAPNHHDQHLVALRLAVDLFDMGRTRACRERFVRLLSHGNGHGQQMRAPWLRSLTHRVIPSGTRFRK